MRPADPSHYPPRTRAANVEAITELASAEDQAGFEERMRSVLADFHPGLLHELDVAVATAPADSTEGYEHLGSELFLSAMPQLIERRRGDLELDGDALQMTVDQHRSFFTFLLEHHPDPGSFLGQETVERIEEGLAEPAPSADALSDHWYHDERSRLETLLGGLDDAEWVTAKLNAELCNALLTATDNPLARLDARRFIRAKGAYLPTVDVIDVAHDGQDVIALVTGELETLGREASEADLHHYAAVCRAAGDVLRSLDPSELDRFRGRIGLGSGHCGRCSMNYAATGLASFDPTCPGLFDHDGTKVRLTLEHTSSTCPFCRTRQRIHAPALFYSPERNQVVYHLPMVGMTTEAEAIEAARPVIEDLRTSYLERVDPETATGFERAPEEICFDMMDFLYAIQMGTTARENHVFNLIGYDGGAGAIVDVTKGVTIELTPGEYEAMASQS